MKIPKSHIWLVVAAFVGIFLVGMLSGYMNSELNELGASIESLDRTAR